MSRVLRASARNALLSLLAMTLVAMGGLAVVSPAAAGAPIIIDDFSGHTLGARTVTLLPRPGESTTPQGTFSQAGGVGTMTSRGNGNTAGGTEIAYSFASPMDITAAGNNTQFFLEFNSIQRTPVVTPGETAAQIGIELTDSSGRSGTYFTGVGNTGAFNIVLNFNCVANSVCFSGTADFTAITAVRATVLYPSNYDENGTLVAVLNQIRTTPTGGVQPPPPSPVVTVASSTVQSVNPAVVTFDVQFFADGEARTVTGFELADLTIGGTATPRTPVVVTGGPLTYHVAVGPVSTSGTITLGIATGAVVDGWGQDSLVANGIPVITYVRGIPPDITSAGSTTVTVGVASTFTFTATGNPAPAYTRTSGTLPSGLTLSSTGVLSGTAAAGTAGTYPLGITATNFAGTDVQTFSLVVNQRPAITSSAAATFVAGTAGTFTVTTTGAPTSAITKSVGSALPTGVTFTDNGNGTATLAGTPGVGSGGSYPLALTATNGVSPAATATLTLTVNEAPAVSGSPAPKTVALGSPVTFAASATGFPTPTVKWQRQSGGGSWIDIGGATFTTLTFTPVRADFGSAYRAVFTNTASTATTSSAALTLELVPSITSSASTVFTTGIAGSFTVTTDGLPVPTILSGVLPAWLSVVDNGNGTATVSGTPPTSAAAASIVVALLASNGVTPNAAQNLTITVNQKPVIDTDPIGSTVEPGTAVTLSAAATGFPVPTVQWQRSVSGGASFADISGETSSTVSFTSALSGNGYLYRAVFTNAAGSTTTAAATLRVGTAPSFTSSAHATFIAGVPGSFAVTALHGPSITASGLPAWLSLTDNGSGSATLTGTAPTSAAGATTFTLAASNTFDPDASQSFTITVDSSPVFTSSYVATFRVGESRCATVETTAGFPLATALSTVDALPSGVTLVDNGDGTAAICGTPLAGSGGAYPLQLRAVAIGGTATAATQGFVLTVLEQPAFTSADLAVFTASSPGSFTVTTSAGFPVSRTFSQTGTLPAGVSFTDNGDGTATLSGTPSTPGSYALNLEITNGVGTDPTQSLVVRVDAPPTITSVAVADFTVGTAGSFTVATSAGFPVARTTTATGTLPPGLAFTDNGDGTATLNGTPNAGSGGSYSLAVSAQTVGGSTPAATQSLILTIHEVGQFTSVDHTTFVAGSSGSFTVTTGHAFPATTTFSTTGALPSGVSFTDNLDGTATISGTPSQTGSFALSITSSNEPSASVTQSFALQSTTSPTLTSGADGAFVIGVDSSITVTSTPGFPTATALTLIGTLPAGLGFIDNGDGTATISGLALLGAAGDYPVRVEASNGVLPDNGVDGIISVAEAAVVPLPPTLPALDGAVNAPTTAAPGATVTLTGSGYAPWAPLEIGIYSLPTVLGTIFADSTGAFSLTVTLPAFTGSHTLVVAGIGADGDPLYIGSAITLAAKGNLAHSGDDTSAPLLLFALLLLSVGAAVRTRARAIGRR